jgi:hypothetical protein
MGLWVPEEEDSGILLDVVLLGEGLLGKSVDLKIK